LELWGSRIESYHGYEMEISWPPGFSHRTLTSTIKKTISKEIISEIILRIQITIFHIKKKQESINLEEFLPKE